MPAGVERVTERRLVDGPAQVYGHPGWAAELPWLVQGITGNDHDMSLFGGSPAGVVMARWQRLRDALGCRVIVHARQVHQAAVLVHERVPDGVHIAPDADGHATAHDQAILAVSVADCVPIFVVAPGTRAIALLHGGWRGVAAGILEQGIATLRDRYRTEPATMRVHLGPAICGACFEVGPEVVAGLGLAPPAEDRGFVDLRADLATRALAAGVPAGGISASTVCTRCGNSPFYSHRGGCSERQVAVLALRPVAP
jgi:polyphenol oxidase